MGRAAALLTGAASDRAVRARLAAAVGPIVTLAAWDAYSGHLPAIDDAVDVVLVGAVLLPAAFLVAWLLLPLADEGALLPVTAAVVVLTVLLDLAGANAAFNVAKVVAFALVGFCFLQAFEVLSWVVVVALVIPLIDIASVYRGPTRVVVEEEPGIFERIAVGFAVPGEDAKARLGPPDFVFFAMFLAAAARFGLRVRATWVGTTAAIAVTLLATYVFDLDGLPALPAVALGFLAPNADLLLARARRHRARAD